MKQELCAYLVRDDGRVSQMPTDELLVAIDRLMQAGIAQEQSISSDKAAIYEFLQTLKQTTQTSRDWVKHLEKKRVYFEKDPWDDLATN